MEKFLYLPAARKTFFIVNKGEMSLTMQVNFMTTYVVMNLKRVGGQQIIQVKYLMAAILLHDAQNTPTLSFQWE